MQGDKKGISSIKINDQYRLEFMVTIDTENEPVITICTIKEITGSFSVSIVTINSNPGEIVKEELEYRGISQKSFAKVVGVSYTMLNDILNGKRPMSTEFALLMEAAIGISADLLVNMQTRYNLQMARKDQKNIDRFEKLRNICASLL